MQSPIAAINRKDERIKTFLLVSQLLVISGSVMTNEKSENQIAPFARN
jgi:hypothetical protein